MGNGLSFEVSDSRSQSMDLNSDFFRSTFGRLLGDVRYRVLIVEDNPDIARSMTLLLQHCGFDVQSLCDGHQVLATARSFRPYVILLDIGLPGLNGYQVAELLRQDPVLKKVVIIAVSAYSPDMHQNRSLLARFDHYLVKPVQFESLLSLLKQELHRALG
jgi:two-component system CheB/CheR fusion protein